MIPKEMKCPICGGKLYSQGQNPAMKEKWNYGSDNRAIMHWFSCGTCGRDFDVCDPLEEDRNDAYKEYWDEHQDELLPEDYQWQ